ncbi:MAG: oligoendopeptidase F [Spirochaetes bacterium]|nr:oligoendopeptidase F [Spirochaetota bacterium]
MSNADTSRIPSRSEVSPEHAWDLSVLYSSDEQWEKGFEELSARAKRIPEFKGTLAESPEKLAACLEFMNEVGMLEERLGYYAHLRMSEDVSDSTNQERMGRFMRVATEADTNASFITPEIQAIDDSTMESFLASDALADFRIYLRKLRRYKPHVLSEAEERVLSMQQEANQTASRSFGALTDADMDFGDVETPEGKKPLSQSSLGSLLLHRDRDVRRQAYLQFHDVYEQHKNTLTNLYAGSVHLDVYKARVRKFPSARAAALFPDDVPENVYDNLLEVVGRNLEPLQRYYALRQRVLGLEEFHIYDAKVPLVEDLSVHHTFEQAVETVSEALSPLGDEYVTTLREGMLDGWVDRYENKGKRSGAFSAGSYVAHPFILMNFKDDDLRDVFTLAHEGGHAMHSWYSAAANPFQHYDYTIFEAEVASTFNEQLLFHHLLSASDNERMRAYLLNHQIDQIVGTLFRQTMFAEFEKKTHEMVESGQPLTVDNLRGEYRSLLEKYFGADVVIDDVSDIEGLRIPHFYRAFYVYKYATGVSAAISLSHRVLEGGQSEREDYFAFLKSGGSRFPIESLRLAGVDMAGASPIETAIELFSRRVAELEAYFSSVT